MTVSMGLQNGSRKIPLRKVPAITCIVRNIAGRLQSAPYHENNRFNNHLYRFTFLIENSIVSFNRIHSAKKGKSSDDGFESFTFAFLGLEENPFFEACYLPSYPSQNW